MDGKRNDLVEPEGVNAGSAVSTAEGRGPDGPDGPEDADVTDGGHPERADDQAERTERDPVIEAPFAPRDADTPSLEQSVEEGAR